MTLNDLAQGEDWMHPEERQSAADIVRSLRQTFADRQIPETTFLILRVHDYLVHHTLCRRLDRGLMPDPAATAPAMPDPKLAEQIGKSRDRLRRTLKELEDAADKLDPSALSAKTSAKGKGLAKGEVSGAAKPCDPTDDPNFIQHLIEEVGIDLNDEEFFAEAMKDDDEDPIPQPEPPHPREDGDASSPHAPDHLHKNRGPYTSAITPAQAGAQSLGTR